MNIAQENYAFLQSFDWDTALSRCSLSNGIYALTIMIDKENGKIKKIADAIYHIPNTVVGGIKISVDFDKKPPSYSLMLDAFDHDFILWESVIKAFDEFNSFNKKGEFI